MLNMIIDAHTHIFSPEIISRRDEYCSSDACFGLLYSNPVAKICTAEDLVRSMDENGVAMAAVQNIGWTGHDACVRSNDYILESVSRYGDRLTGFCAVQPLTREKAVEEIGRCGRGGAKGIGELRPDVQGFDLCDLGLMGPLMAEAAGRGMVVSLHSSEPVGHNYTGKGSLAPGTLYKFISNFRDNRIILAHFGGGLVFYELMPEVKDVLSNTYYDTAAAPFLYSPSIYKVVTDILGPGKMLFGSDWPLLSVPRVLEHIRESGLDRAALSALLGGNAQKLFTSGEGSLTHG